MRKRITITLIALTVVIGTVGFMLDNQPFYYSLLHSLKLLSPGGDATPNNIVVEIGRWTGTAFALSLVFALVVTAVSLTSEDFSTWLKLRKSKATAVHGDGVFADQLAKNLGKTAIRSDRPISFKAPTQVLLFSTDEAAIEFFNLHKNELAKAEEVYLCLYDIKPEAITRDNIYAFSLADTCAQLYWQDHPVFAPERIALIGSGAYAESLITQGLLVNIFSVEGGVEYAIYGKFGRYQALHRFDDIRSLDGDIIDFKQCAWFEDLDALRSYDRIVLCDDSSNNMETAAELRAAGVKVPIHMRCDSRDCLDVLGASDVSVFGTADELCSGAIVIQQKQHDAGKICAITYQINTAACNACKRQTGFPSGAIGADISDDEAASIREQRLAAVDFEKCLSCPVFETEWKAMDEFTKASNYAVAAHDAHKRTLLRAHGIDIEGAASDPLVGYADLPLEVRDELQEIEHIRWCRFHFLNNWSYAPGDKNKAARTHHYLVPYDELERDIKDLDSDSYRNLWYRTRRHTR